MRAQCSPYSTSLCALRWGANDSPLAADTAFFPPTGTSRPPPGAAVYHDSCAALRECKIKEEPRVLLSKVLGLELVEMADTETCCGFGGTFAVKFDGISSAMAQQKVNHALDAGAEYIISTDASCLMHLQSYIDANEIPLKTMHLADVLAHGWGNV